MELFRQNRRLTWLALCALAVQLLIGFGHVHNHAVARAEAVHAASCSQDTQPQCPSHDDQDERHCPICWALSLAGTVVLPQPPSVDLPISLAQTFEHSLCVISLCGSETIKFQARAPPTTHVTL